MGDPITMCSGATNWSMAYMGVDSFRLLKKMRGIYVEFSSPVLRIISSYLESIR